VEPPIWRRFEVDGEVYYWTAYSSEHQVGEGPWQPVECLMIGRPPRHPGCRQIVSARNCDWRGRGRGAPAPG
jgi:hypothetical protein